MANYSLQVVLHGVSGLAKDDYVNVLYYSITAPDTVEGQMDEVAAAYTAKVGDLIGGVNGMTIKAYENAAGQPVKEKNYPFNFTSNNIGEMAICLSYATVDDPAASTKRRRGRIYIGPLAVSTVTQARPSASLRSAVLDFGELLAQVGTAGNTTWMMHSKTDSQFVKIESIWVDDAWDTQRRRGLAPTTKTTRDVQ